MSSLKTLRELAFQNNMPENKYSNFLIKESISEYESSLNKDSKEYKKKLRQDLKMFKEKEIESWHITLDYDVVEKIKIIAKDNKLSTVKLIQMLLAHRIYQISYKL